MAWISLNIVGKNILIIIVPTFLNKNNLKESCVILKLNLIFRIIIIHLDSWKTFKLIIVTVLFVQFPQIKL